MRNQLLLVAMFFMVTPTLVAQTTTTQQSVNLHQVIPPSPTAASLGTYGDVGVGYFTGLPDISVPLYEVTERGISLPISLHYNASGTRVAENASWVGLGWSLAAGGVITRTVRGLDDFKKNGDAGTGYYYGATLPANLNHMPPDGPSGAYDKSYFQGIKNGTYDAEPDIFTYNFGPYSGKFLLGKQQDGSVVLVDEQNNLRIDYSAAGWRVTDAKGYQYVFADGEESSSYSYASPAVEAPSTISLLDLTYQPDKATVTTAWYLSSITAPTGEVLTLTYGRGESLSLLNKAEDRYDLLGIVGGCQGSSSATPHINGRYSTFSASKQVITDRYLQKITFSHGTVEFITTPREDIEYRSSAPQPAKLAEILVKDLKGIVIRDFQFSYGYFGSDGLQRRLRLESLTEVGQDGVRKPPYRFAYYAGDEVFYDKYSKSTDHWGYYNGSSNTGLVPALIVPDYSRVLEGANREPEQTRVYPKQGVLATLTYPTGGRTVFDYELHDYANIKPTYKTVNDGVFVHTFPGNTFETSQAEFTLTDTISVTATYSFTEVNCAADGCQLRSTYTGLFFLDKIDAPVKSIFVINNTPPVPSPTPSPDETPYRSHEEGRQKVLLKPGRYRARVWFVPGYSISMGVYWDKLQKDSVVTQTKGGGLRVKSIANYDGDKLVRQRTFRYTTDATPKGVSSGVLMATPEYALRVSQPEDKLFVDKATGQPIGRCDYVGTYMGRFSSLLHPVGFTSRATVGYRTVTEVLGAQGEGGRTVYNFSCDPDIPSYFPTLPAQGQPLNGKLLQRTTYAAEGNILEKEVYEYNLKISTTLAGVKVFVSPAEQDANWSNHGDVTDIINLGDIEGRFFSQGYQNPEMV